MYREYHPLDVAPTPDKKIVSSRVIVVKPCPKTQANPTGLEWLIQRRRASSKNGGGQYETPGGKCDRGDSITDEGLFETREENGCQAAAFSEPVPFAYRRFRDEEGKLVAYQAYGFLALALSERCGSGDGEADNIGWQTADEVAELTRHGDMRSDFLLLISAVAANVSGVLPPGDSVQRRFVEDVSFILAACEVRTSVVPEKVLQPA